MRRHSAPASCFSSRFLTDKALIAAAVALPVDGRAKVVDSLLQSLNMPQREIDEAWAKVASRRMAELKSGAAEGIPGEQVRAKVQERFAR